jgi:hypothetical protein
MQIMISEAGEISGFFRVTKSEIGNNFSCFMVTSLHSTFSQHADLLAYNHLIFNSIDERYGYLPAVLSAQEGDLPLIFCLKFYLLQLYLWHLS